MVFLYHVTIVYLHYITIVLYHHGTVLLLYYGVFINIFIFALEKDKIYARRFFERGGI